MWRNEWDAPERMFKAMSDKKYTVPEDRMYVAPEQEVPEKIKDLLVNPVIGAINGEQINDRVLQAYRRGKASR